MIGRLEDAKQWLERAFHITDNPVEMKLMVLDDPDWEPLWKIIRGLKA